MKANEILLRAPDTRWMASQIRELVSRIRYSVSETDFAKIYRMVRPYTMSSGARLRGLYEAVNRVLEHRIPGDVVECGTARGGSAALMGLTLQRRQANRTLWVLDTFEGLPPPTHDDPDYELAKQYIGKCRGDIAEVTELFETLGLLGSTKLVQGLFQETVPRLEVKTIAVLHLDGDWYQSVKVCLDHLYDRVASGGVIQIDDYGHWQGARRATDEFLQTRGIESKLTTLDYTGRQFIKM